MIEKSRAIISIFSAMVMEVPKVMLIITLLSACVRDSQQLVVRQYGLVDHQEGAVNVDSDRQGNLLRENIKCKTI